MTEATMIVGDHDVHFLDEEDPRARVDRVDQIPHFPDEAAERVWWSEHTLSEEFWRNADPVPDSELPPTRKAHPAATGPLAPAASRGSTGSTFLAGFVVGGVLGAGAMAGALWLIYKHLTTHGPPGADFLPTNAPRLPISPV